MAYNVLIVDDSLPMRAVIRKTIQASGFNVGAFFEAANGKEALEILRREWMDLVMTDYNMPEMNGLEMLEAMKKDDVLKSVPVVMVTTEGSSERIDRFMKAGIIEYIRKPFTPEEVCSKLNRIMGEGEDGQRSSEEGDEDLDF